MDTNKMFLSLAVSGLKTIWAMGTSAAGTGLAIKAHNLNDDTE